MKKTLLLLLFSASLCFGQQNPYGTPGSGDAVHETEGPPIGAWVYQMKYTANILQAICYSPQSAPTKEWATADASLTNIIDSSNTATATMAAAHGLYPGARITVQSATANLAKTYTVATVPSTTTLTFTTASVADATYSSAIVIRTGNPRSTEAVWAIKVFKYDGSNNMTGALWASISRGLICDNWATY